MKTKRSGASMSGLKRRRATPAGGTGKPGRLPCTFTLPSVCNGSTPRFLTRSGHAIRAHRNSRARPCTALRSVYLLLKHLFNLADFLLDFAGELFASAFCNQFGVIGGLTRCLFDLALHFTDVAFDLILRARFHVSSPRRFPA